MQEKKDYGELRHKALNILGIVLCVILVPILIINCILLIKGWTNADEVPTVGGIFPMIVYTDSMSGVFESGDLIICKSIDPKDVVDGDVITFFDPAGNGTSIVTHRVERKETDENGKLLFYTKGDFNNAPDDLPVPEDKLVGKYIDIRIPGAGHVALFMQTTPGLILCVLVPLIALIAYDFIRRKLYEKQHAEDKDELLRELEELRKLRAAAAAKEQSEGEVKSEAETEAPAPLGDSRNKE